MIEAISTAPANGTPFGHVDDSAWPKAMPTRVTSSLIWMSPEALQSPTQAGSSCSMSKTPASVAAKTASAIVASMASPCTKRCVRPALSAPHTSPLSVLVNTPWLVAAYTFAGEDGSISNALTYSSGRPSPAACQLSPPSVLLNTCGDALEVMAKSVAGLTGSMTNASTSAAGGSPVPAGCQVAAPSMLLKTATWAMKLPNVAA